MSGLAPGTYTVTITDANGCTATKSATITQPNVLASTKTVTNVRCNGQSNGAVDLTVTGGTTPYTYAWSNGATTQDLSNVAAGTYTVLVTDANNCTRRDTAVVTQPNVLAITETHTNATCNGTGTGAIDITVTGGTTPYTYIWSNGATTQDLSGLAAGTYTVTVTDANGCSATKAVTLTQPSTLNATTTATNVKCFGGSDGTASVSATGGTTPYTYRWSTGATTATITGRVAGTYNVTVTDANNCQVVKSVTITQPGPLTLGANVTPVTCFGLSTGAIDLTVTGGTSPFTYSWNTTPARITEDISGLSVGNYRVTVIDANQCSATLAVNVPQPDSLTSNISKTDVSCGSGNSPCSLLPYEPTEYTIYLPNLPGAIDTRYVFGATGGSFETFPNGTAHIYGTIYNVLDTMLSFNVDFWFSGKSNWTQWSALGRSWKGDTILVGTNYLNWDYYTFDPNRASMLFGRNTYAGQNLTATHNPPNYFYGLQVGLAANDKNAGYGLSTWFDFTGFASGKGDVNALQICDSSSCNGTTDLTVNGGTAPYTYAWSNGSTTQDLTGLCPGIYTVTATDSRGCTTTNTVTINSGAVVTVTATGVNVSCSANCDGSASATATGGTAPYTYLWSNGASTQSINNLCGGTYYVTMTDARGCRGVDTVVINANPRLDVTATPSPVLCFGGNTGSVSTTINGGVAPYTYSWTPGGATTANISGLAIGTYTVIVTDRNGCRDTASAIVTQPTQALTTVTSSTPVSCIGGTNGTATVTATGGTAPYTYRWSTTTATTATITGRPAGSNIVTVTDANGCTKIDTVVVTTVPPLTLGANVTQVRCNGQSNGAIDLTVTGGTAPYTYTWNTTPAQTTQDIQGLAAGTYRVTVVDANSCSATLAVNVTQPNVLAASETHTNVTCNGAANGSIDVTVTGGTAPFTYAWSNAATTQDLSGLAPGTYTVTITDANGCTATKSATITQPNVLASTKTVTNVRCNGQSNGAVDLTVTGGTTPYTYAWSNGATTQDLSNVAAGTYTVLVTDANSCTRRDTAVVTQPNVLALSSTKLNVACNGGNNGSIDLSVTGGTTPYTYAWNTTPVRTTQDISGLVAGIYRVTVTDANGCSAVKADTISELPGLAVSKVVTNVRCFGENNGAVDITVSGGTGTYTYVWSNGATTQDLQNLVAGTYRVTVVDGNNCSAVDSAVVTQPALLTSTTSSTPVSCIGGNNGTASVSATGGTAPYTYRWSTTTATTATITGRPAGTNFVTVTDANGCTVIDTAIVTTVPPLTLGANVTQVRCFGQNNGAIDLTVTGGTAPYTYTWSTTPAQTTQDISGLTAGNYRVSVVDANGCSATLAVNVNQPNLLTITETHVDILCNGGSNGSIDLTVVGGTAPYTYSWNTTPARTTQDITGLAAGTYIVLVTDNNGCTVRDTVTLTQPPVLALNVQPTSALCSGTASGTINLTVTGGVAPYSYIWSNGATTEDLANLATGTYTVTVTDANGCTATGSGSINQPPLLVSSKTVTNVTCFGGNNGAVDLAVSGGTAPYTYLWSNAATTQDLTNITAGTYTVAVTDANGCIRRDTAVVTQPTQLVLTSTKFNVSCNGGNNASIDLSVSGGVAPYTYAWNTTPVRTTQDISGLAAGIYRVTVTDANGCTAVKADTITELPSLATVLTPTPVRCFGQNNGSVDLSVSGGTGTYTYLWSNGATTQDLTALVAGTYSVTVRDGNQCSATGSVTVTQPTLLTSTTSSTPVSCIGGTNGTASVSATGGTAPYTYRWSTTTATTATITGRPAGMNIVTVTDANGCTVIDTAIVTTVPPLTLGANVTPARCFGESNGAIDLTVTGGTPSYTYTWNTTPAQTTQDISGLVAGTYRVTAVDANGCSATLAVNVTQPNVLATTETHTDVTCNGLSNGSIDLTVTGGSSPYTYAWSTTPVRTTQDISGLSAGTYTVVVTDNNGCIARDTVELAQPQILSVTVVPTAALCNGTPSGTIDLRVGGGVRPYTFLWSTGATTEDINGLVAGTYTVTVTDANGCTILGTANVLQPQTVQASATSTSAICNGSATGTATASATGGTTPYTYAWSNGGNTATIGNLAAGTYIVTVTDVNGCSDTAITTVTQPAPYNIVATGGITRCYGSADGTATVQVSGNTGPYTYTWSNQATGQNISGLAAGIYSVTVRDANGCTGTDTARVSQPDSLTLTTSITNVLCSGQTTGAIDLTVTGGTGAYTYNWMLPGGMMIASQDISGAVAGTYTVFVADANSCRDTLTVSITQPAAITATTQSTNVLCFGGFNGSVDLTVSGGVAPYTYRWSNNATSQDITGLAAGLYMVTITDANGCRKVVTAVVNQPGPLTLGAVPSPVRCSGGSDGHIDLTVTGGTPGFIYTWSTGATTQDITGLTAGTYRVTVVDANGCSATVSSQVSQPNPLSLSATKVDVTINGGSNGSIDLTVAGGTSPYTYLWSNQATTEDLTNIPAGTYCVTVTDNYACTATTCVTVQEPACTGFAVTAQSVNVACYGSATGSINLTVQGNNPPFVYAWSNGAATQNISGLRAGTYTVTVTNAVSCSATQTVTISQPDSLTASAAAVNINCNGATTGAVNTTVNGGIAPYTYLWNNQATTANLSSIGAGSYVVTVTDANNCTATASATVTQSSAIVATTTVSNVRCFLGVDGSVTLTVSGGATPYTYRWSNNATSRNLTGVRAGTYTVTITDALGCTKIVSAQVTQPGPLTLGAVPTSVSCFQGNDGTINLTVQGGVTPYQFTWSTGATTEDVSGLAIGTYRVTVVDANSCSATLTSTVNQPQPLQLQGSVTNACDSAANGSIDVSVIGGTAPYTYRWSNQAVTEDIFGLLPNTYTVTVTDNKGCSVTASYTVGSSTECARALFALRVMLEGPYNGSSNKMNTGLNSLGVLPNNQPYNSPVMNYQGTESITTFSPDIVDWVLISFRTDTNAATTIHKLAAVVTKNGDVLTATGDSVIEVVYGSADSLYVVVEHRNHMGIMSSIAMPSATSRASIPVIDFTRMQSYQIGTPLTSGQKVIGHDSLGDIYGMYSGDGDCNYDINSNDFVPLVNDYNNFNVYSPGDFNMDGDCNSNDIPKWVENFNLFSGVQR
ncbi:MAG: SprB repeat-containing protein [Chitinophagales bacterium]|nr:SprB repeat-containing protein [Chitinophagales bacterium]